MRLLALGALVCSLAAAADAPPEDLVILAGLRSWGDAASAAISRVDDPPGGWALDLRLAGAGAHWFTLDRAAVDLAGATAVEFDLRVDEAADGAALSLCLVEPDDDRWIVWDGKLADVGRGAWRHVVVPRERVRPWQRGEIAPRWDAAAAVELQPSGAAQRVRIAGLAVRGPRGLQPLLDAADDGVRVPDDAHRPMAEPLAPGTTVFTLGLPRVLGEPSCATALGLREAVGAPTAIALGSVEPGIETAAAALAAHGLAAVDYSQFAAGYQRFVTRRGGWEETAAGRSLNRDAPGDPALALGVHALSFAHPAARASSAHRFAALARAGIGEWFVVDFVFPYYDFGYAPATTAALRADLAGDDAGLVVRDGDATRTLRFADYVDAYLGFVPTPRDVGLADWRAYERPRATDDEPARRRESLFQHLLAYEWLKLGGDAGRAARVAGGHGVWLMPNEESTWGGPDLVTALRVAGVRGVALECFGRVGETIDRGFASLPCLAEAARRGGGRVALDFETGVEGHGAPYWGPRTAFTAAYAMTAETAADLAVIDFLDEAPIAAMRDPANPQSARLRDGVAKARGFRLAWEQRAGVADAAPILAITDRPMGRTSGGILAGWKSRWSFARALRDARLPVRERDSLDLARELSSARVVAYAPQVPRVGDLAALRDWVAGGDRVLVTHTFVPTRDARAWPFLERGGALGAGDGGDTLGLGAITRGTATRCRVTAATGRWAALFPVGREIALGEPLTRCARGDALVDTDQGPLVVQARVGPGRVVFVNAAAADETDPVVRPLWRDALLSVAAEQGIAPWCAAPADASVQSFAVAGGRAVCVWDDAAQRRWDWRYAHDVAPLPDADPGVDLAATLPAAAQRLVAYDFWSDATTTIDAGAAPTLRLRDAIVGLWFIGPDDAAFAATLARLRAERAALAGLGVAAR